MPAARAAQEAASIPQFQGGHSGSTASIPHFIRLDFADASRGVFYAMAIFMAVAAVVAGAGLRGAGSRKPGRRTGAAGQAADQGDGASVGRGQPA